MSLSAFCTDELLAELFDRRATISSTGLAALVSIGIGPGAGFAAMVTGRNSFNPRNCCNMMLAGLGLIGVTATGALIGLTERGEVAIIAVGRGCEMAIGFVVSPAE